jgi:hypothetical protein
MTPTRKKEIQAYLTGHVPAELQDKKIVPPSDSEVKTWLVLMPSATLRTIGKGPFGKTYFQATNEALGRLEAEAAKDRPVRNGRIGSGLQFVENEVLPDLRPIDPSKK